VALEKVPKPVKKWDGVTKDVSTGGLYLILNTGEIPPLGTMLAFEMTASSAR